MTPSVDSDFSSSSSSSQSIKKAQGKLGPHQIRKPQGPALKESSRTEHVATERLIPQQSTAAPRSISHTTVQPSTEHSHIGTRDFFAPPAHIFYNSSTVIPVRTRNGILCDLLQAREMGHGAQGMAHRVMIRPPIDSETHVIIKHMIKPSTEKRSVAAGDNPEEARIMRENTEDLKEIELAHTIVAALGKEAHILESLQHVLSVTPMLYARRIPQESYLKQTANELIELGMEGLPINEDMLGDYDPDHPEVYLESHQPIERVEYIILALNTEGTVEVVLKQAPTISPDTRFTWAYQMASGLADIHRNGIVHHDLKVDNIMLTKKEGKIIPRFIDFGCAQHIGEPYNNMGNRFARSPEMQEGRHTVRASDDSWGLAYSLLKTFGATDEDTINIYKLTKTEPRTDPHISPATIFPCLKCFGTDDDRKIRVTQIITNLFNPDPTTRMTALDASRALEAFVSPTR